MNPNRPATTTHTLLNGFFLCAGLAVLALVVYFAVLANSDLAIGRFALFMDERITFDGVRRTLHPAGLVDFIDSVLRGDDQRYGRSLWNAISFVSAIPERLFGDTGQIIATRMLQVALIVTSYCIFAFGLIRSGFWRFVLLVPMLAMPFSDYFMTMPKPEPLQLLFLSVFAFFFVRRNAALSWYWIFIGLAFGTKISTLPALIVFVSIALAAKVHSTPFTEYKDALLKTGAFFALGVALAVPLLLWPLLLSAAGYLLVRWVSRRFALGLVPRIALLSTAAIVVVLASKKVLKIWIGSTFLNTTHGADQASINAGSWLTYFFDTWLVAPRPVGLLLLAALLIYLAVHGVQVLRSGIRLDRRTTAFALAMAGLALNVAILIGVKRLWGFYLYPGMVLMVVGTVLLADLSTADTPSAPRPATLKRQLVHYAVGLLLVIVAGVYWLPKTLQELHTFSLRSSTPQYAAEYASYQAFGDFLQHYPAPDGKRLRVMFTPSLFPPTSNAKFEIVEFWGPYVEWSKTPDILIFGQINTPRGEATAKDSPAYASFVLERDGYAAHVTEQGGTCKRSPCYEKALQLANGGEVLVLKPSN